MTQQTLSPEVREALERLASVEQRSEWPLSLNSDFIAIRAELMRLAEECATFKQSLKVAESERDELRARVENAPVILLNWINGSFSATVENHRMIEQQELHGKSVALVVVT